MSALMLSRAAVYACLRLHVHVRTGVVLGPCACVHGCHNLDSGVTSLIPVQLANVQLSVLRGLCHIIPGKLGGRALPASLPQPVSHTLSTRSVGIISTDEGETVNLMGADMLQVAGGDGGGGCADDAAAGAQHSPGTAVRGHPGWLPLRWEPSHTLGSFSQCQQPARARSSPFCLMLLILPLLTTF